MLASKKIKNEATAFQPARDNPNISYITSSHLIGDLLNKYVSVSFEKSIFDGNYPTNISQEYLEELEETRG